MGQITDAFRTKWTAFWLHVINNPKTSLSGLYSFLAVFALCVTPFIPGNWKIASAVCAGLSGSFKLYNGLTSKDPGKQTATTPENPVPHAEPSVEVPINPEAKVVI